MFFDFHLPNFTFPGVAPDMLFDRLLELAHPAGDEGFDIVTVMDTPYRLGDIGPGTEPFLAVLRQEGALHDPLSGGPGAMRYLQGGRAKGKVVITI